MIREVNAEEFRQCAGSGLVLVDFYSSTCGPCKMLSFVLNDVDKACGDIASILKVEFGQNPELVEEYHVSGYPTLILLKDGQEAARVSGLQQKPAIVKMIQDNA